MGYQLEKNEAKINHLFFMDDLKLYGKNDKEVNSLMKTACQCSEDMKMEFWYLKMCRSIAAKGMCQCSEDMKMEFGVLKCACKKDRKQDGKEFNYRMERE